MLQGPQHQHGQFHQLALMLQLWLCQLSWAPYLLAGCCRRESQQWLQRQQCQRDLLARMLRPWLCQLSLVLSSLHSCCVRQRPLLLHQLRHQQAPVLLLRLC